MRFVTLILAFFCCAGVAFATDVTAAPADCDRTMALPDDQITASDIAGCFAAAKALDTVQDMVVAEKFFAFVCAAADLDVSPDACASLGHMYDARLEATAAMTAYSQSCFHPRVETADGEGCLTYGTRLLAAGTDIATDADTEDRKMITTASRAFQRGCIDGIAQACAANETLQDAIFAGEYGFDNVSCQIKDSDAQVTSDQICKTFSQHTNLTEGEVLQDGNHIETFYIWPDTDLTRTAYRGGLWSLNGRPTGEPRLVDGYLCLVNPLTERQFCAEMPD